MAHADQFEFIALIKKHLPESFQGVRTLEIGSLDINGSIRSYFSKADYTGVDVAPGTGVDEVCQGQLVDYPSGTFDVVVSCECLEHNPFWVETVSNMFRMVKPGGLVVVSCATTGRAEHGTSRTTGNDSPLSISIGWEYYRNVSASDFKRSLNLDFWCEDYILLTNWHNCDLYFVGIKKPSKNTQSISNLRIELARRFKPTQSLRSTCMSVLAKSFGEYGGNFIRAIWQLIPRKA